MNDRNRRENLGRPDAPALTRRHLGALLCATFLLSPIQAVLAGDGRTKDKDRGDKGGDGNREGDGRGRDRNRDQDGATNTDRDRSADRGRDGSLHAGSREGTGARPDRPESYDQEKARQAVAEGHVLPLKDVLDLIDQERYGIVIAIDMSRQSGNDVYRMRTRDGSGVIHDLRIDARTGKFLNILGF